MNETQRQRRYLDVCTAVFIACLLAANIIAVKIISLGPFTGPAGTIVFPVSYIINDILTEVYGFRVARRVIWLGFAANVILVGAIVAAQALPAASFWDGQASYERILGATWRVLLASFTAYIVGSLANAWIMARMKVLTGGRWLWTRTIGSTLVGEGLDSWIFVTLAFAWIMPWPTLLKSAMSVWVAKVLYEVAVTPLTYAAVNFVRRAEGGSMIARPVGGKSGALSQSDALGRR